MEEAGILRRVVGHAAHSIRLFGNDMAHGDFIEPVGDDEANMVMSLMNLILDETYRIPAEVSVIEAVAAGRRAPGEPPVTPRTWQQSNPCPAGSQPGSCFAVTQTGQSPPCI
jgi:hypothetical protein